MRSILILLTVLFIGCGDGPVSVQVKQEPTAERSPQCPFGRPVFTCPDSRHKCITPIIVTRDQYELAYWPNTRTPLWVCETVTAAEVLGDATRKNYFKLDPQVPRKYQTSSIAYTGEPYDKGHLAAAANQKHSQFHMNETFYVTNIAPQNSNFNRGLWAAWESRIRSWATENPSQVFYVISGTLFGHKPKRMISHHSGDIEIPSHFYKIIVTERYGEWRTLALMAYNDKFVPREYEPKTGMPEHFNRFITNIIWLEEQSSLDFMPFLSKADSQKLELIDGDIQNGGSWGINAEGVVFGGWQEWEKWLGVKN